MKKESEKNDDRLEDKVKMSKVKGLFNYFMYSFEVNLLNCEK